ncbi:MAG: hypothetical protein ACM3QS_10180 [Bacteroidota bacterium]
MQPLISSNNPDTRREIMRARRFFGLFYGFVIGLAFAAWCWGIDSWILSRSHAFDPWLKFAIGALLCVPVGMLAGWLVMRFEHGVLSVLIWLVGALFFAWVSAALPFQIAPWFLDSRHALPGGVTYPTGQDLLVRMELAFVWVAIFVLIAGLLELPLGESAAFSTSIFGRFGPSLLCIALMGISGFMVDGLNNQPLRDALVLTDKTIQFMIDHEGQQVDPALARANHLAGLRTIADIVDRPRQLAVGQFDRELGQIHVLVNFADQWADCLTVYGQFSACGKVSP